MFSVHSVVGQMFVLQLVIVVLLAVGAVLLLVVGTQHDNRREATNRSLAVAEGFANAPGTGEAMRSSDPTALLQPRAESARKGSGVDFVVVTNRAGIRYTHPVPDRIGKHITGDLSSVLAGRTKTEQLRSTLGPQIRVSVPIEEPGGRVIGGVSAGVTLDNISGMLNQRLPIILGAAAVAVAVTMGGAAVLSRRLLRQTHGLGPAEVTRMYEHHDAVLHSVKEGVLIVDQDHRLMLANDEAQRLLDLPPEAQSRHVDELGLPPDAAELLASGREATDEVYVAGERLLAVNQRPIDSGGSPGIVATLRDSTELRALSGKAEAARARLNVLFEASMSIGTTLEVTRTAEELAEAGIRHFADFVTVDLAEPVLHGEEPVGTETELRRSATAGIRADSPLCPTGELITLVPSTPQIKGIAIGRAVIEPDLSNAPGWRAQDPERARRIVDYGIRSLITVPLTARGMVLGVANFWRSEKPGPFEQDDLALAEEVAARAAVCIDNARRYTREHNMAATLQRSLLPRGLPEQNALEIAHRYLPAQAGVGGDWFDVIPLPGSRVALVVGDVVGHGVHAAATMGRLRTAVQNFSALDLPPDELLWHLDELVDRMDQDQAAEGSDQEVTGATCLYAIYDPVTGDCALARAGHPPPAIVNPDGTVEFPDVPVSPPLGAGGGLPFEAVELHLAEGSRLILYTDGLIENRHRDINAGIDLLRNALTGRPDLTPEETCTSVLDAMLPSRSSDDIALLAARTRLLEPAQVAEWDVPPDPAAVAPTRIQCARQLKAWGLEEITFSTELILSELITNAIRYGQQPIRVRLVIDRQLICEVSDGSSTSPHLRRAAITDEGGRGLFLVAQFAERWGTRYSPRGKVIWAEQALHSGAAQPGTDQAGALLDQWGE